MGSPTGVSHGGVGDKSFCHVYGLGVLDFLAQGRHLANLFENEDLIRRVSINGKACNLEFKYQNYLKKMTIS